jgi:hypothetical protein
VRFVARHVSLEETDGVTVFALGDQPGHSPETQPVDYVILSFGEEDDQDRALRLTGLYIECSEPEPCGYRLVRGVDFDGRTVSIRCVGGREIHAMIDTDMMSEDAIRAAVEQCNIANGCGPDGDANQ